MKYYFLVAIAFSLFSCGSQTKQISGTNQTDTLFYKFIYLDKYYTEYLREVKTDFTNRNKIHTERIQNPILNEHFKNSEYSILVRENLAYPIQDTSGLTNYISELNSRKKELENIISEAFIRCNKHLKNDSITFYILPTTSDSKGMIRQMGGVSGSTAGSKQILLTIDFNVKTWKENLELAVAHEFNHAYWTNVNFSPSFKWTLLEYLIFEGKADSFAHFLYPNAKAPWTTSLTDKGKEELWNKIKPKLQSEDFLLFGEVMFGSKNYPVWGGYSLGFDIVQTALKNNPELTKTNWTNLDSDNILGMSSYK